MAEKYFKYLVIIFFAISIFMVINGLFFSSEDNYNVNVTQMVSADKGLDLKAVGEVLKKAKDAKEFEVLLNDRATGVNNLDLDENGKVDYINVTEFGEGNIRGFSLSTKLSGGEVQEIATIKVEKEGEETAKVETKGNETIYGRNHYYHSSWSPGFGTGLLMGYMFSSHRPYISPWGGGYYPSNYYSYPPSDYNSYRNRTAAMTRNSNYKSSSSGIMSSNVRSPHAGKNARAVKAPLKNPTSSQRTFQSRNPSKQLRSGGFGRRSSGFKSRSTGTRSKVLEVDRRGEVLVVAVSHLVNNGLVKF